MDNVESHSDWYDGINKQIDKYYNHTYSVPLSTFKAILRYKTRVKGVI